VKAGPRNARAKGKRLGRPPKDLETEVIAAFWRKGLGWWAIAAGGRGRNSVSRCPRVFQNSGKVLKRGKRLASLAGHGLSFSANSVTLLLLGRGNSSDPMRRDVR